MRELTAAILRFEAELAAAEAAAGVIPVAAASQIAAACGRVRIDAAAVDRGWSENATPVITIVESVRAELPESVRPFVHHGATSQDAVDTAAVLLAAEAATALVTGLDRLAGICAELAATHRDHVAAGRTLGRRARPTTFGLRAAGWLGGTLAARRAVRRWRGERAAVQLGGAAGSLDVLGDAGLAVADDLARRLGLRPAAPWHGERSRIVDLAAALALCGNAGAKVAGDVVLLGQDEIAEVEVAAAGASSAMPGKRNPARAVMGLAAHRRLIATMPPLWAAVGELERAAGAWQAEIAALPAALQLAIECVDAGADTLDGLKVDVERMRANAGGAEPPAAAATLIDRALAEYRAELGG